MHVAECHSMHVAVTAFMHHSMHVAESAVEHSRAQQCMSCIVPVPLSLIYLR